MAAPLAQGQGRRVIILGSEIRFTDCLIPIQNVRPTDDSARPGGWGTIRGEVPYTLHPRVLRFSAPLDLITNHPDASSIDYLLGSYVYGAEIDRVQDRIRIN